MDLINPHEQQAYGTIADHSPALSSVRLSPNSPYESFEFHASPRIPHTPSYNGSYQNSPYTTYSELSNNNHTNINEPLGLFDDDEAALIFKHGDDYDPVQYDAPTHIGGGGGLQIFDLNYMSHMDGSNPHIQLAVTPPADQPYESAGTPYDHSSPASSAGGPGAGDSVSVRSRASSLSSNHMGSPPATGPGNDHFARQFEALNFNAHNGNNATFSPPNKAQSPPRLVIAESSPNVPLFPIPPEINAPDGEGGRIGGGPELEFRLVPATPVSGGGAVQPAVPSFQNTLGSMQHGVSNDQSNWQATHGVAGGPDGQSSVFTFPPTGSGPAPQTDSPEQLFVPHNAPRHQRSKSETSLHHPVVGGGHQLWTMPQDFDSALDDSSLLDYPTAAATAASSPGASTISFASNGAMQHQTHHARPAHFNHNFSYGPPSSTAVLHGGSPHMQANMALHTSPHLSPMMNANQFLSPSDAMHATQLRRSVSDGARRVGGHRHSRSEDLHGGFLAAPGAMGNGGHLGFMQQEQFLSPTNVVPSIRGSHHRRASSGSRSERGVSIGFMGMPGVGVGGGGGVAQGIMPGSYTARTSPYPSPNASPRGVMEPLPNVAVSRRGMTPGGAYGSPLVNGGMLLQEEGAPAPSGRSVQGNIPVRKQNVTTHATSEASKGRRKGEAAFVCPVPGCGSTFTRHFNLKGHLRSHNEEKPYLCKWPGCAKSFARQHDCKRHENLHLNIRPFTCEGCKKTFARMDALNRHLRSEGGTECQKVQAEVTNINGMDDMDQHLGLALQHPTGLAKAEDMGGWDMGQLVM